MVAFCLPQGAVLNLLNVYALSCDQREMLITQQKFLTCFLISFVSGTFQWRCELKNEVQIVRYPAVKTKLVSRAPVTTCHTVDGLEQQKLNSLTVLDGESPLSSLRRPRRSLACGCPLQTLPPSPHGLLLSGFSGIF